ncbi:MAG: nucleotide exchange factor GrpE [Deltaproteobacteria bacterium]|nr:MAG: nucleotide exchange factor GrpE [Deltaproteobacteria bacterium]
MPDEKNDFLIDLDTEETVSDAEIEALYKEALERVEKGKEGRKGKPKPSEAPEGEEALSDEEPQGDTASSLAASKPLPDEEAAPSPKPQPPPPGEEAEERPTPLRMRLTGKLALLFQAKEAQIEELTERYRQLSATFENYKKQVQRERSTQEKYGYEPLLKAFLPVLDNFDRALLHARDNHDFEGFLEGVELIYKEFLRFLQQIGVVQISVEGQKFDPHYHQAMMQIETEEVEPNTIIAELRKGYLYKDRLLRATMVSVAKAPGPKGKKEPS